MKKKFSIKIQGEKSISLLAIDIINSGISKNEVSAVITVNDVLNHSYKIYCENVDRIYQELKAIHKAVKVENIFDEITVELEDRYD